MQILAIETSAKAASAALVADGVLKAEYFQNSGQTHSRTLLKLVQDMLQNCDTPVAALDAVACAIGPGSFTGVRIGLAAAKGLCWGADLPLYGVSTLAAMAYGAGLPDGLICPVMDARRSQVYTALFCADRAVSSAVWQRIRPSRWQIGPRSCALTRSRSGWSATALH